MITLTQGTATFKELYDKFDTHARKGDYCPIVSFMPIMQDYSDNIHAHAILARIRPHEVIFNSIKVIMAAPGHRNIYVQQ